jgi:hypothetical protein
VDHARGREQQEIGMSRARRLVLPGLGAFLAVGAAGLPLAAQPACGGGTCTVFLYTTLLSGDFGGLANADGICQVAADDAGLGGTYKAWLSDNTASPSTRFTRAAQPYVLPNGGKIAADWADLTDSRLDNPIVIDAFGQTLPQGQEQSVWTGTSPDGTAASSGGSPANCGGWTGVGQGFFGTATPFGPKGDGPVWSSAAAIACAQQAGGQQVTAGLYCFQQ